MPAAENLRIGTETSPPHRVAAIVGDHRDDRVGTAAAPMDTGDRGENRVGIEPRMMRCALQLERAGDDAAHGGDVCF